MAVGWSEVQRRRLRELGAESDILQHRFADAAARDRGYQEQERRLVQQQRRRLHEFRHLQRRPSLCVLEGRLAQALVEHGFVQVTTPVLMAKGLLERMAISREHPLWRQIYWVDDSRCLRPMLAPHLYYLLKDLLRLWEPPVRLFEVGPCFRKETQGSQHASEFTMLNLVEWGLPLEERRQRLQELSAVVMAAAAIDEYRLVAQTSEVYGDTIDIVGGDGEIELGSAAMGPHRLDAAWRLSGAWVGIGFGLERLLMVASGSQNLARFGRSLAYLDGIRLNI